MTATMIAIDSEAQWLAERAKDVTSTEVSVLYGLSPYVTEFELWHRKRAGEIVTIDDNERMRWGRRLESAIARGVAEDRGWQVRPSQTYARDEALRLGASFDFLIDSAPEADGPGVMEIKNVDGVVFRASWDEIDHGVYTAPAHIEMQLQAQLAALGWQWGAIVALVGGNSAHVLLRERDDDICASIRARVADFWTSIEANKPPAPDYMRDADFIVGELRRNANAGEIIDANSRIDQLIGSYSQAWRDKRDAEARCSALRAEIIDLAGTASAIRSAHGGVSCGTTRDNPGTVITADMVGTIINARRGSRQFRFTPPKEK